MNNKTIILLFVTAICIASCSVTPPSTPQPQVVIDKIELEIARASLASAEYENFTLQNKTLIVQCGESKSGRNLQREQRLVRLSNELLEKISLQANELLAISTEQLDPPGHAKSMFDPGKVVILVLTPERQYKFETNLDQVARKGATPYILLNKLVRQIRQAAELPLCGNNSFFLLDP